MPWKECSVMDEKMRFVARLIEGEPMAELCREFGISRPTGYKIWERYRECGLEGLPSQSRRPHKQANQLPMQVEKLIVQIKCNKPMGSEKGKGTAQAKVPKHQAARKQHSTCGSGPSRSCYGEKTQAL